MSEEQAALQQGLVARYDRLRTQKVDPREDNALAITTDGRKLALDARLVSSEAEDYPESKVNRLVAQVVEIYQRTMDILGTQLIFCDLGVHETKWGFSVYDDVLSKLHDAGIPREALAAIGEADSDSKKQSLFDRVRSGRVRVLMGSTMKMGTGTNVQKRLVALHHLDAPWKPAEVEQREGRILRQGNDNAEVAIYRYVTQGSFDAYMWQALETKARFIAQVITGQTGARRAEDVGTQELSYAEVKAIASGNPAVLTLAEADAELQRLQVLQRNHSDEQYLARNRLRELPGRIERLEEKLERLSADAATCRAQAGATLVIGKVTPADKDQVAILGQLMERLLPRSVQQMVSVPLGQFHGLTFGMVMHPWQAPQAYLAGRAVHHENFNKPDPGPRAVLNALDRLADRYSSDCHYLQRELDVAKNQLRDYQAGQGSKFLHAHYLEQLTTLRDQLRAGLAGQTPADGSTAVPVPELAAQINALKDDYKDAAAPAATVRSSQATTAAAEAVTTTIQRRQGESK
jgi:hypothetical protein